MNDPSKQPIDIEEQRHWLMDHRRTLGASWTEMAKRTGIPSGTISQFGSEKGYAGDEEKIAEKIYRYRQLLTAQASIDVEAPEIPDYYETETSKQLAAMLSWAQRGRVVVAAMGAGLGKSRTARYYSACYPNVFVVTLSPSTSGVNNMQIEVLDALGERDAAGTPQKLSRRIRERVRALRNPLIIVDEAQHASEKTIEEMRSWNDAEGVGIALFGNESVLQRLEGGSRRAAFAQLYSRVSMRMVRSLPLIGDVEAMAAAWEITAPEVTTYLRKIVMAPGGLRSGTMALELATMLAASERRPLDVSHLQDAWAQLSSRAMAS